MALDANNGWLYVADWNSSSVIVINGSVAVGTIPTGPNPTKVVFDPADLDVYVLSRCGGAGAPCPAWSNSTSPNTTSSVSVIRNTTTVGTFLVGNDTGQNPGSMTCDSSSGLVYVANWSDNTVSVVEGQQVVETLPVPGGPHDLVFDQSDQDIYVADYKAAEITLIHRDTIVATISMPKASVWLLSYDPKDNYVFVGDDNQVPEITVIDGEKILGNLSVGGEYLEALYFDPGNLALYVCSQDLVVTVLANGQVVLVESGYFVSAAYLPPDGLTYFDGSSSDQVYLLSTVLGISPPILSQTNGTEGITDAGQSIDLESTLWGLGTNGSYTMNASSSPVGLFACGRPTITSHSYVDQIYYGCHAEATGPAQLVLSVTDGDGGTVRSWINYTVWPSPVAGQPFVLRNGTISPTPNVTVFGPDVGQSVGFLGLVQGGSPGLIYTWQGFHGGQCQNTNTALPTCIFTEDGFLEISYMVSDSGGGMAESTTIYLVIFSDPSIEDVTFGQAALKSSSYSGTATVTGGLPPYHVSWSSLPVTCIATDIVNISCSRLAPGNYQITGSVIDANGFVMTIQYDFTISASRIGTDQFVEDLAFLICGGLVGSAILFAVGVYKRIRLPPSRR